MLFFLSLSFLFILGFTVSTKFEKVIYIDAGHGGFDGGAVVNGINEADINLAITLQLKTILEECGYKVLLTRDGDYDLSTDSSHKKRSDMHARVDMINSSDALLYISIHQNTYTNPVYSGAQCFYNKYDGLGMLLANNIQTSIINDLKNTTRVAKNIEGIYLVDNVNIPGVLVECGFMSNESELNNLLNEQYQYDIARSIYRGMLSYLLLT